MEVTRHLGARIGYLGFVAQYDSADLAFYFDPSSTMIGEACIVIADDPDPIDPRSQAGQEVTRIGRQPVAAERVVKTVAKTIEACRASPLDFPLQRLKGRERVIWGEHLAETSKPASLFEVQISHKQSSMRRPVQCAVRARA